MSQPVVLVTFSCDSGATEKLALSAAVGAVQARALIRLRRIANSDESVSGEEARRMRKEYVRPAESDVLGADALIVASGPDVTLASGPWQEFLSMLRKLSTEGRLDRKVGASIGGVTPALAGLGLVTVTQLSSDPLMLGRSVAEMARSLKSS